MIDLSAVFEALKSTEKTEYSAALRESTTARPKAPQPPKQELVLLPLRDSHKSKEEKAAQPNTKDQEEIENKNQKMDYFREGVTKAKTKVYENYMKTHNALSSNEFESAFAEGMLTPEEFVQAGDALVHKFPTWKWGAGKHQVEYLPPDKQYLITENVPSLQRVGAMNSKTESITVEGDDDDWVGMVGEKAGEIEEIPDVSGPSNVVEEDDDDDDDDDDDIPDVDDFDSEDNIVDEDTATLKDEDTILKTRTYDINITYDKYYRTPRVWLFGYDENRKPLQVQEIFADISAEHAKKTVTFDAHPHLESQQAYIHPCKHAEVMKKIIGNLAESGKELRVDLYMPLFLKFISSVIPTIDYDFTC
eukprot:CAMPEP_0201476784 /NCGR_PEP_ID=MMETSP0151_2-20130828/1917_1 /ASSEMBLY_ACC=CAM_ASM_000257 /TAXON_ID=200890 /ORGANISM="Paramoeba atlantica, Strain 621/1 / CCAP 1560/9" /LENGTH=361 /DNA_ID=CAMNT_0047857269 /DNA_START=651 /DNA_END=1737 /DNA_ORIENTATION=-